MKDNPEREPNHVFIDFGLTSMKALVGNRGIETALVRTPDGRFTEETCEAVRAALLPLVKSPLRSAWTAHCALPAKGVSVRRFLLPPASRDATRRLLDLQLEQAFPVAPRELAYGYRIFGLPNGAARGNGRQDVAVLAVRRSVFSGYADLLAGCGLRATFTLGTLASGSLCPADEGGIAVLDVGRTHTEWLRLQDGRPVQVRIFAWGGNMLAEATAARLDVESEEAERLLRDDTAPLPAAAAEVVRDAVRPLAHFVGESIRGVPDGEVEQIPRRLYLVGGLARRPEIVDALAAALGDMPCHAVPLEDGPGRSAVTLGLQRMARESGSLEPIHFADLGGSGRGSRRRGPGRLRPWITAAAGLFLLLTGIRYLPAIWSAGSLRAELAAVRQQRAEQPRMDKELRFIEHLEARRPRVLEALTVYALAAPPDAVLEKFSLNERGVTTLQVRLKPGQHNPLRARLARSGWFSGIVLQDLKPAKPRNVSVRLTATLTPPPDGLAGVEARMGKPEDGTPPAPPETPEAEGAAAPESAAPSAPEEVAPPDPAAETPSEPEKSVPPGPATEPPPEPEKAPPPGPATEPPPGSEKGAPAEPAKGSPPPAEEE